MDTAIEQTIAGQYLTFQLGRETYGLNILSVREIIEFGGLTEIPLAPPYLRGVINLRGTVIPVTDLLFLFELKKVEVTRKTCVVIVEVKTGDDTIEAGLMVDAVTEVVDLGQSDLDPPPAYSSHQKREFIRALAKHQDHVIVILNEQLLLSLEELSGLGAALAAANNPALLQPDAPEPADGERAISDEPVRL